MGEQTRGSTYNSEPEGKIPKKLYELLATSDRKPTAAVCIAINVGGCAKKKLKTATVQALQWTVSTCKTLEFHTITC